MDPSPVATRFPPSPTGELHIGSARTALFNWLFARRHNGRFILRIEDTDQARSTEEATKSILEAMKWLGLDWDEGPYYQSRRLEIYRSAIQGLVDKGRAYYCHCPPEVVEKKRQAALARKRKPIYDRTCREKGLGPAPGAVVRLKSPLDGATVYEDRIMGPLRFDNRELDDLVLLRSDGTPTYHLACVVDDVEMGMTHIIRGQDHVNNTPRQILIYQALEADLPVFAHLPMINGPDGRKLSKRHGATSVMAYQEAGYLPQALLNYLVRLGWSHGDEEVFSRDELIAKFDLEHIGRSAGVFDPEKLLWLNAHYIKEADDQDLTKQLLPFFQARGAEADPARVAGLLPLFKPRAQTLTELADQALFLFAPLAKYEPEGEAKFFKPETADLLEELAGRLEKTGFGQSELEELFRSLAEVKGVKLGAVAQPVRLALTGRMASPGLFEIMAGLGRGEVLKRIRQAAAHIRQRA